GVMHIAPPVVVGNVALDVEYAARNGEIGRLLGRCAEVPLTIGAFAEQLARFCDHAGCDVAADIAAAVAGGAQEAQEITESAAKIEDGGFPVFRQQSEKLRMTQLM